jgi:hypothetical protein
MFMILFLAFLSSRLSSQLLTEWTMVDRYLEEAGLNTTLRYKVDVVELCRLDLYVKSSLSAKSVTASCTRTQNDAIVQTFVRVNDQFRCSNVEHNFIQENTNFELLYKIRTKYFNAFYKAYQEYEEFSIHKQPWPFNNTIIMGLLKEKAFEHDSNIKNAKNTAKLSATASSQSFYGGGGKCDLTLMGKIMRIDV